MIIVGFVVFEGKVDCFDLVVRVVNCICDNWKELDLEGFIREVVFLLIG